MKSIAAQFKLIAIDLDGTLLDHQSRLSERSQRAIQRVLNRGYTVVICTGRLLPSAKIYAGQAGICTPIVAVNGALVAEQDFSTIYHSATFPPDDLTRIFTRLNHWRQTFPDLAIGFGSKHSLHYTEMTPFFQKLMDWNQRQPAENQFRMSVIANPETFIYNQPIYRLSGMCETPDVLSQIYQSVIADCDVTIEWGSSTHLEILPANVSKAHGLAALLSVWHLDWSQVIAIGNESNDLALLKAAGYAVVVANASEAIQTIADYIAPSNDEDGAAQFLDMLQ